MSCHTIKNIPAKTPEQPNAVKPVEISKPKPIAEPIEQDSKTDPFLTRLLEKYPEYFKSIIEHKKQWNIQIIYTAIDRDATNNPTLTNHHFNVNRSQYYYPASTVKLPVALMALQHLNELKNKGVDRNTTMITEAAYSGQAETINDPTTADGKPTIANYIKKILLASDNEAFNRLYEFLGQQYINDQLKAKGYANAEILHRLDIFLSEDENRHTNPVKFLSNDNNVIYQQEMGFNQKSHLKRNDFLGKSFYRNNVLIDSPMNFSKKNRLALEDLHNILRSLIFPTSVPAHQRFNIAADDYRFMYQYMSQYPSETVYPGYDSAEYYDAYVKFLLNGNTKESLPKTLRIFNKVGDAYGEMIDVAYVADFDHNIEFFLSAAINCTIDGVINNDNYAYDSIGYPFMKNLGRVIYDYELSRKRNHIPDLSQFKMTYDR
jgi:cell division protein FtsI/penicillin-binding protein 2